MQATWSQPVAEVVVASQDFASRGARPRRPGPAPVSRGRHDQRSHRQPGHVHGHDPLGTPRAAVGATAVMEGEPAVGGSAGEVGVDDHHRGCRLGAAIRLPCRLVQHGQCSRPGAVARPAAGLRPHTGPGPERLGQKSPLAAGVGDVEHRVYHPPQVRRVFGSSLARSVDHRFQQRPLLVGQVTGVRHAVHGADRPCYGSRSRIGHT